MGPPDSDLVSFGSLFDEVNRIYSELMSKVATRQAGVFTFFDNVVLAGLKSIMQSPSSELSQGITQDQMDVLLRWSRFRKRPRFATYSDRRRETVQWKPLPWELTPAQFAATQGVENCVTWRGLPVFKTVFDLALYSMLVYELRPLSIIELGSGTGGSALWFADLLRSFQIGGHIYSLSLHRPSSQDPRVVFIEGDGCELEMLCQRFGLDQLPHPWLVIEDMHVNTLGVMRHYAKHASPGDYVIIEDSENKQSELAAFEQECGPLFEVDSLYTDFFGRNTTCSLDSIFIKV